MDSCPQLADITNYSYERRDWSQQIINYIILVLTMGTFYYSYHIYRTVKQFSKFEFIQQIKNNYNCPQDNLNESRLVSKLPEHVQTTTVTGLIDLNDI